MHIYNTVNDIRKEFLNLYQQNQFVEDKSGTKLVEILNASFVANENSIFGTPNFEYIERELQWYRSQSLYVNDIPGRVPKIWQMVASKDGKINSNYGYLIWSDQNFNQYQNCLSTLISHPQSRRAVMIYTRPSIQYEYNQNGMSDFICTNSVQYFIRENSLIACVFMRSNDGIFGYPNDKAFQNYVHKKLLDDYNAATNSSIKLGKIYWNVASLHIYSTHFNRIESYINGSTV
jgi:thymidylate synthase